MIIEDGDGQDLIKQKGSVNLLGNSSISYAAEQIRLERGSSLATDNGNIVLAGNIDNTSTRRSIGVWANGSQVSSNTGAIEVTGVGGIKGSANRGIYLRNTEISSGTGDIDLVGSGGGTGSSNDGIHLARGTRISAGSHGHLSLDGSGGDARNSNRGIYLQSGVSLSVDQGRLSLSGQGGDGRSANTGIIAGRANISSNGPELIQITGYSDGSTSRNLGLQFKGTSVVANGDGRVSITGISTQSFSGSGNHGMDLRSATISARNGDVNVAATGGRSANSSSGLKATRTEISSEYGNVTLSGVRYSSTTGSNNRGVDFSRGTISSGGDIKVTGFSGNSLSRNTGLRITSSELMAGNNATLAGTSRGTNTGSDNRGIEIRNSDLSALTLSIKGIGGGGIHRNVGLTVLRSNLIGRTGDVVLDGQASVAATGSNNRGTEIKSSLIQAGADAVITGLSGRGLNHNEGVRISRSSIEAGPATRISINGMARNDTTGKSNTGIYLHSGVSLKGGSLVMSGTGGGGTDLNHGIHAHGRITTDTGSSIVVGASGAGLNSEDEIGDFFP